MLFQKPGGAQAGETGADNGDAFRAVRDFHWKPRLAGGQFGIDGMRHQIGDGNGIIVNISAAAVFARAVADPAEDAGQREIAPGGGGGQAELAGPQMFQQGRDPEVGGANPLARRQAIAEVVAE